MVDLSSLSSVQVETIRIHQALRKDNINLKNALRLRKTSGISRGTHYRILSQAKKNIRQSLFTVATAVQMGLIDPSDVQKLLAVALRVPADVEGEKLSEIMPLVVTLVDRIVML